MSDKIHKEDFIVNIKNATISHHNTEILKDVNLKIKESDFYYLIGKTGSGKSSLLKTLYADIKPTKGKVVVAGYDISKIKTSEIPLLRRELGIVFQDFQLLYDRNVFDNLKFVLNATGIKNKKEVASKIEEVLSKVELHDKQKTMPFKLSGGEQQRIVIARAIINNPKLIIADEPTGNLDPETSSKILRLLRKINLEEKTAVIMATHDQILINKYPAKTIKSDNSKIIPW